MTQCNKQFDPSKPCRGRNGKAARVICANRKSNNGNSIIALFSEDEEGIELPLAYQTCGHISQDHSNKEYDLINISDAESELERLKRELENLIDDSRYLRSALMKKTSFVPEHIRALQEIELRIITIWKSLDK